MYITFFVTKNAVEKIKKLISVFKSRIVFYVVNCIGFKYQNGFRFIVFTVNINVTGFFVICNNIKYSGTTQKSDFCNYVIIYSTAYRIIPTYSRKVFCPKFFLNFTKSVLFIVKRTITVRHKNYFIYAVIRLFKGGFYQLVQLIGVLGFF